MLDRRAFLTAVGLGAVEVVSLTAGLKGAPLAFAQEISPELLSPMFFKRFHGERTDKLMSRRRTRLFFQHAFAGITMPFWKDRPLWSVAREFMNKPDMVSVEHHRYVVASGCMAHCGPLRAMMWLDAKQAQAEPTAIFAFVHLDGPSRELWITSNKNLAEWAPSQIPRHFTLSLSRWIRSHKPMKWDGGLINRLVVYDHSKEKNPPAPEVFGLKSYRRTHDIKLQAL